MHNLVNLLGQNDGLRKQNISLQQENTYLKQTLYQVYSHINNAVDADRTPTMEESLNNLYAAMNLIRNLHQTK